MGVEKVPAISVLMSVYKEKPEWLEESINSILNQTFKDFEFIIVNDNPEGVEQKEVLDKYQRLDDRIIVIQNPQNLGLAKSLNRGLEIAKGKYVARMDADDISLPDRFSIQYHFMEDNLDVELCGGKRKILEDGYIRKISDDILCSEQEIRSAMLFTSPMIHPTVFFRKGNLLYNDLFKVSQDYELWERYIELDNKIVNINKVVLLYRMSSTQSSFLKNLEQMNNTKIIRSRYLLFCDIDLSEEENDMLGLAFLSSHKLSFLKFKCLLILLKKMYREIENDSRFDNRAFEKYALRLLLLSYRNVEGKVRAFFYLVTSRIFTIQSFSFNLCDIIYSILKCKFWRPFLYTKYAIEKY